MSRQQAGDKAYKLLDLLTGIHDPAVSATLQRHGLNAAEIDRGWALLRRYAETRRARHPATDTGEVVNLLHDWASQWFAVGDAALAQSFPKVHEWLFDNLTRQAGSKGVAAVMTLLGRVKDLEGGKASLGKDAKPARERLRDRGLTAEVIAEAQALLARLETSSPQAGGGVAQETAAEDAFWAWYLEWSAIARAVLKDKALLNHLGFGKVGRPRVKKS